MLTIVKLRDAEYVLRQIAGGIEEYYVSAKEAPGVWAGNFAEELGLSGLVEADLLRRLVAGVDPTTGTALLERPRKVNAFDVTLSAPKSVSLMWALGTPEAQAAVSIAHVEAVSVALHVLESHAAVTRRQVDGVRRQVPTSGLAVGTFVHRSSRAADPQLHTHAVVANVVRRDDGRHVALDASSLYDWAKAVGSIYQEELRRRLSETLGVRWGPDRNGTREIEGFTEAQLRAFSKRSVQIEDYLEAQGSSIPETPAERRAANDAAALATRSAKDPALTPEVLRARWEAEASGVGLRIGQDLLDHLPRQGHEHAPPSPEVVFAHLLDSEQGLCARSARFGEAQVTAAVAATGAGTLTAPQVQALAGAFLSSEHVVRLATPLEQVGRRPPQWSLVAHRRHENLALEALDALSARPQCGVDRGALLRLQGLGRLGPDQLEAVQTLLAPGPALRVLVAPAGYGKTTTLSAAVAVTRASGRPVVGVAPTHQAVKELRAAGIPATTLASLLTRMGDRALPPGTLVVLDEVSQVATTDAARLLGLLTRSRGTALWAVGDAAQAQSVRAGGLAAELEARGRAETIPAPGLTKNRRQLDPAERAALSSYRGGDVRRSQALRAHAGFEHELEDTSATTAAMAKAVLADLERLGPEAVVALAATHAEAEALADQIRAGLADAGQLDGPELCGPGWTTERRYRTGDRVLLHAKLETGAGTVHNGSVVKVTAVSAEGLAVSVEGNAALLRADFLAGRRFDGSPNCSHAWVRTVEGAQGGTFEQVHLLASPALDRQSGYVAQSRGRRPTHTWSVRRQLEVDHGGTVVEPPSATEVVVEAFERDGAKTFAAREDPFVLDRRLRGERAAHGVVLAKRPPDHRRDLELAMASLSVAGEDLARSERLRAEALAHQPTGVLSQLSRKGRAQRTQAQCRLEEAERFAAWALDRKVKVEGRVTELEAEQARSQAFQRAEGWRQERINVIDRELAHHWTKVVLGAVREGEPLAFGITRLRAARDTVAAEIARGQGQAAERKGHPGSREVSNGGVAFGKTELAELDAALASSRPPRQEADKLRRALVAQTRSLQISRPGPSFVHEREGPSLGL